MPFDWNNYKDLAEDLRKQDNEASKRSSISRIYYAVFNQAKLFLEDEGFLCSQHQDNHSQVWNEFMRRGKIYRYIGNLGDRLRRKRNSADYDQEIIRLDDEVELTFNWANQLLTELDKIKHKFEN